MSNNLSSQSLKEVDFRSVYPSLNPSELNPSATRSILQGQTTVVAQASQEKLKLDSEKKSTLASGAGPALPKPKGKQNEETLSILAEAFGKAFAAISSGSVTQTEDYTELQQLDETMSQGVLKTQTDAIDKEETAITLQAKISKQEKSMQKVMDWLEPIMITLSVAMIAVTLVATFFDGGATAEAIPEEIEMTAEIPELPDELEAPEELEEEEDANQAKNANQNADNLDVNDSGSPNYMQATQEMMAQNVDGVEDAEQGIARTFARAAAEDDEAGTSAAKKIAKVLLKLGVGVIFGSPMLITGIYNVGPIHKEKSQLASDQSQVGDALGVMQEVDMTFKFFQKFVQREGGTLEEEINGGSQVIQTFADVTNAWKGISYGLAQVV